MNRRKLVKPLGYSVLLILLLLVPLFVTQSYILHILILVGINIILASSLRLIATSGQLSLGHGGMVTVGAYTSALLVMKLGFSTWAALPLGGLAAWVIALIVGYPFVRLKGIYFAMITVFLAEVISLVTLEWTGLTGGSMGIFNIPHPNPIIIPGLGGVYFTSRVDFYYFALVLVLVTLLILYAIERSRINVTLLSISQAESLAESIGVNTPRFKVIAFSLGCFFAGIAGAFYAHYLTVLTPTAFGFFFSIYIVIYMIVGGMRRFSGPILGAIILTLIPEFVRGLKEYQPFLFAAVLIIVIFFMPEGLVGLPDRFRKLRKPRFGRA
jgi:branched-chain amino acid transport system permease protein